MTHSAHNEGMAARLQGTPPHLNPYPLNTVHSRQWSKGWRAMDEQQDAPVMRRVG